MLTQYIHQFFNNFDQKKTMDQLQSVASSKDGVIGIATALILISGVAAYKSSTVERGCPQVPCGTFSFGSTSEYRENPVAFVKKWEEKLGPVFGAQLFGQYATIVSGPQVREIFSNENFSFMAGIQRDFDTYLLANGGSIHDLPPHVVSGGIKKNLSPKLPFYTSRVIEHLKIGLYEQCGVVPDEGKEFDHVYPFVQHMVAKASASVFVGPELAKDLNLVDSFKNMVLEVGSDMGPKPYLEHFPHLMRLRMWYIGKTSTNVKRHRDQLFAALVPQIDSRLKAMKEKDSNWDRPNDFLQDILETDDCPPHMDIYSYCVDWMTQIIFAALHTTSENGTIVLYRLLDNPKVLEELYEEQNAVLEEAGYDDTVGPEVFTREILNKFVKMDSVIRESCRLRNDYIGLPHTNVGKKTIVLSGGAMIRPGENAFVNFYSNHRDEKLQKSGMNANNFEPYRFVDQGKNSTKIGDDFMFFGMFKHACPGRWFAIQEIKTILAMLIRSYKMSAIDSVVFPTSDYTRIPTGRFKIVPRK
ncbi:cytochrome P450 [Absidia repens]|uniref:Cytochrome P450 n=1 Tax=Absidia repens TaxID=90262 RepID=A0A1X2HYB6_9FUNG|nr:cytochrome P450 [Absidia repens]